jgi:hypothetical protein
VAFGQITGALEVHARAELGEPELLESVNQIGHHQMDLKMRSGLDAKSLVMKSAEQPLIASMDFGVSIKRPPLGIKAFYLVDFH